MILNEPNILFSALFALYDALKVGAGLDFDLVHWVRSEEGVVQLIIKRFGVVNVFEVPNADPAVGTLN